MLNEMPFSAHDLKIQETALSLLEFISHERPELLCSRWAESLTAFDWVNFGLLAEDSVNALEQLKSKRLLKEKTINGCNYYRLSGLAIKILTRKNAKVRQVS